METSWAVGVFERIYSGHPFIMQLFPSLCTLTVVLLMFWQIVPLLCWIICVRFPGQLCSAHRSTEPTLMLKFIFVLTYIMQSSNSLWHENGSHVWFHSLFYNVMWLKTKISFFIILFFCLLFFFLIMPQNCAMYMCLILPLFTGHFPNFWLLSWMFVAIGYRSDVFHPSLWRNVH